MRGAELLSALNQRRLSHRTEQGFASQEKIPAGWNAGGSLCVASRVRLEGLGFPMIGHVNSFRSSRKKGSFLGCLASGSLAVGCVLVTLECASDREEVGV